MGANEAAADKQLANILATTQKTVSVHAAEIRRQDLHKHMEILKYLKGAYGLGHGNANLLALRIRQKWEGAGPSPEDMLAAQYAGTKVDLKPMMEELSAICQSMGADVTKVVQKTGLAFRRTKLFALVQAPSAKRIQLSLNLNDTPEGGRVVAFKGMCSHKIDLTASEEIDDFVVSMISQSYERC